jgi:hypothetical protein
VRREIPLAPSRVAAFAIASLIFAGSASAGLMGIMFGPRLGAVTSSGAFLPFDIEDFFSNMADGYSNPIIINVNGGSGTLYLGCSAEVGSYTLYYQVNFGAESELCSVGLGNDWQGGSIPISDGDQLTLHAVSFTGATFEMDLWENDQNGTHLDHVNADINNGGMGGGG